jgi:hypothetical protein
VSQGHHYYGFTRENKATGAWYRSGRSPRLLTLTGDFNNWDRWAILTPRRARRVEHVSAG